MMINVHQTQTQHRHRRQQASEPTREFGTIFGKSEKSKTKKGVHKESRRCEENERKKDCTRYGNNMK
jgi:hypothetical protein